MMDSTVKLAQVTAIRFAMTLAAAVAFMMVLLLRAASAGAAATCDAASFTTDGVFDTDGYLACLSGGGGQVASSGSSSSGVLPVTGSSTLQIVGIALGLLVMGAVAVVVAARNRRAAADIVAA
ncbi:LPXTG cell wall anchor domain-containing protein [Ilumatobacter sp.]|uniref:LPXTG cell wall anchor domain-containing protein n=1 Tax=Ilumatobacter sp. TaxID=1967498 RepID=UPI003C67F27B